MKSIEQTVTFDATPEQIFEALMDSRQHAARRSWSSTTFRANASWTTDLTTSRCAGLNARTSAAMIAARERRNVSSTDATVIRRAREARPARGRSTPVRASYRPRQRVALVVREHVRRELGR